MAHINFQSTYRLSAPAGATVWEWDASLNPHPVNFMSVMKTDQTAAYLYTNFLNTQLTGATHALKMADLLAKAQRWRMTYMSVTVQQDGPALADQGTIACAQGPAAPRRYAGLPTSDAGPTGAVTLRPNMIAYSVGDNPGFDALQSMPMAYWSKTRDGAYMPMKLSRTCQQWTGENELVIPIYTTEDNPAYCKLSTAPLPPGTTCGWPFYELPAWGITPGVTAGTLPNSGINGGTPVATSPMLNDSFGYISARNCAPTSSFTFFVRMGLEVVANPGTSLTPFLHTSPRYDPVALRTYFAIARELKDAYPADYNDLGKMLLVIKEALKTAMRYAPGAMRAAAIPVGLAGPTGAAVATGLNAGAGAIERIAAAINSRQPTRRSQNPPRARQPVARKAPKRR